MKIYVLVGEANDRKSSTIRALTGCAFASPSQRHEIWQVEFQAGVRDCYVLTSALQEAGIDEDEIVQELNDSKAGIAIIALRNRKKIRAGLLYPDADAYVSRFKAEGWPVHVASMCPRKDLTVKSYSSIVEVFNAKSRPSNSNANELRQYWKIV